MPGRRLDGGETDRPAPSAISVACKWSATMTERPVLDVLLLGNEGYVREDWDNADRDLAAAPALKLAVVACMDTRHNVEKVLGLRHGDAKVIRNAGNLLDDGT